MKAMIPLLLAFMILLQSMACSLWVLRYHIQKEFISKTLCENRNKPSKGCQGKCYLKKQLKKTEDSEKNIPGSIKEKSEVVYTLQPVFSLPSAMHFVSISPSTPYLFSKSELYSYQDPHPPMA